jgi:hypothetical protein
MGMEVRRAKNSLSARNGFEARVFPTAALGYAAALA